MEISKVIKDVEKTEKPKTLEEAVDRTTFRLIGKDYIEDDNKREEYQGLTK